MEGEEIVDVAARTPITMPTTAMNTKDTAGTFLVVMRLSLVLILLIFSCLGR